jgi:hypothetical protein
MSGLAIRFLDHDRELHRQRRNHRGGPEQLDWDKLAWFTGLPLLLQAFI